MLLLFATHLVRRGMERAAGSWLRRLFGGAGRGRVSNAGAGVAAACALQSATAVTLLAASFCASGMLSAPMALAVVLGADLGTALVVQFLSFNLSALMPVLLTVGGLMYLRARRQKLREAGRVILGISFIFLSLNMLGSATQPLKESQVLPVLVSFLDADAVNGLIFGAVLTFLFHSSVAGVLFFGTVASQGMISVEGALPMVLGANVGGGLVAVWLTRTAPLDARRIALANLGFRSIGAVLALLVLWRFSPVLPGNGAFRQLVNAHLLFNLVLLISCLPLVGSAIRWAHLVLPEPVGTASLSPSSALDRTVLDNPSVALASATREVLRMASIVEVMTAPIMRLFRSHDPEGRTRIRALDKDVNAAHTDIKLFIAELNRQVLSTSDAQRGMELSSIAIGLERVGDIVSKELLKLVETSEKRGISFSEEGWRELNELHSRVMANMHLAMNVLLSDDGDGARQLVEEKAALRKLHQESQDNHLARLQDQVPEALTSSNMHLEVARALKEINSIFVSFAYPTLERSGELLGTRLADVGDD